MKIEELLEVTIARGAFDLHLVPGAPPIIRVVGVLTPIPNQDRLGCEMDGLLTGTTHAIELHSGDAYGEAGLE